MQISLRLKLDEARNAFVIETEDKPSTPARSVKLGPIAPGQPPVTLDVAVDGYVTAIVIPGMAEILAEIQAENGDG